VVYMLAQKPVSVVQTINQVENRFAIHWTNPLNGHLYMP
jgi:hypothetical protein